MKRGFTLIETVISLALVAILIVAVSGVNMMSIRVNSKTRGRDSAFNTARGICEIFRSENEVYEEYGIWVYKYIDDIGEIGSIKWIFQNRDGTAAGEELTATGGNKRYTVFLRLERGSLNGGGAQSPGFKILRVKVFERNRENSPVSLAYSK